MWCPEGDGRSPADSGGDARVAEFLLLIDGVPVTSLDGLFLLVTMLSVMCYGKNPPFCSIC